MITYQKNDTLPMCEEERNHEWRWQVDPFCIALPGPVDFVERCTICKTWKYNFTDDVSCAIAFEVTMDCMQSFGLVSQKRAKELIGIFQRR